MRIAIKACENVKQSSSGGSCELLESLERNFLGGKGSTRVIRQLLDGGPAGTGETTALLANAKYAWGGRNLEYRSSRGGDLVGSRKGLRRGRKPYIVSHRFSKFTSRKEGEKILSKSRNGTLGDTMHP